MFRVVDGDPVRGEIGARLPPDEVGEVEVGYGIAPSGRRRGLASRGLAAFLAEARERAVRAVRAECHVHHRGSVGVLEKNGFERVGRGADDGGPLLRWRRRLRWGGGMLLLATAGFALPPPPTPASPISRRRWPSPATGGS